MLQRAVPEQQLGAGHRHVGYLQMADEHLDAGRLDQLGVVVE